MKRIEKTFLGLNLLGLFFSANSALAQADRIIPRTAPGGLPGAQQDQFSSVLSGYIATFLVIVGILAVAYLIYGGFMYIISHGNEESAEQAKKIIQNAILGLVVIILSYTIVTVIVRALYGQT